MKKIYENEWVQLIVWIIMIIVLSRLIVTFVGQRTLVDGHSMENTLQDNDNLWINKLAYRMKDPSRFDIIVFPHMEGSEKKNYIKRVIALPGETIFIDDSGTIFVDGEELQESYGKETMQSAGIAAEPITLADDEYFVLGDNRNHSSDSRAETVGVIHKKEIVGKAVLRMYPFSNFGVIK